MIFCFDKIGDETHTHEIFLSQRKSLFMIFLTQTKLKEHELFRIWDIKIYEDCLVYQEIFQIIKLIMQLPACPMN